MSFFVSSCFRDDVDVVCVSIVVRLRARSLARLGIVQPAIPSVIFFGNNNIIMLGHWGVETTFEIDLLFFRHSFFLEEQFTPLTRRVMFYQFLN